MNIESLDDNRGKRIEIDDHVYVAVIIPGGYISVNKLKQKSMGELFSLPIKAEWPVVYNFVETWHKGYIEGALEGQRILRENFRKLMDL